MKFGDGYENPCAVFVDSGTTNTRVWLVHGDKVVAHATKMVGIRDVVRTGSRIILVDTLRDLISEISANKTDEPTAIVAAGMVGSPHGLAEVPHVCAPASASEIAAGAKWFKLSEVSELPILIVPGVRTSSGVGFCETDVMRGEETLCLGLHVLGLVGIPGGFLNLGSHWKAVFLDSEGRISSSHTSASGELIHTTQTHTILASSVSQQSEIDLDLTWLEAGMAEQRRSGLARALFCVRLADLSSKGTPEQRWAFLVGAFIASDLDALLARGILAEEKGPAIVGNNRLAKAWSHALAKASIQSSIVAPAQATSAFIAGLRRILSLTSGVNDLAMRGVS